MHCYRKHQFSNRKYTIHLQTNSIKLINNRNAKYTIHLGLRSEVEWFYKNGHLEAFGLNYKGKQKLFHLEEITAFKLKKALGGRAIFVNIKQAYRALLIIGRGSFGKVFKVESLLNQESYACKSMRIDKFYQEEDIQNEIRIQNEMLHPSILEIKEVYREENHYYIITDYAQGGNLKHFLQTQTLTDDQIILIMKQVLLGIEHINQKGYVHRDIKPENILLMKYQDLTNLKLIDFGFATKLTEIQTNHPYCGTPGYMAPEIVNFNGKFQYNEQCDVFSAGVLLFRLISGQDLFRGSQSEIYELQENFNLSQIEHIKIKEKFKTLLYGMLQQDPNDRMNIYDAIEQLSKIEQFDEINPEYEIPKEEGIHKLKYTQIHQFRK